MSEVKSLLKKTLIATIAGCMLVSSPVAAKRPRKKYTLTEGEKREVKQIESWIKKIPGGNKSVVYKFVNHHTGVGLAEMINSALIAYRDIQLTSKDAEIIKRLGYATAISGAAVLATKSYFNIVHPLIFNRTKNGGLWEAFIQASWGIGETLLRSLPNICDGFRGLSVADSAKKIAENNKQRKYLEVNKVLLGLIAAEAGFNLTAKSLGAVIGDVSDIARGTLEEYIKTIKTGVWQKKPDRSIEFFKILSDIILQLLTPSSRGIFGGTTGSTAAFLSSVFWLTRFIKERQYIKKLKAPLKEGEMNEEAIQASS